MYYIHVVFSIKFTELLLIFKFRGVVNSAMMSLRGVWVIQRDCCDVSNGTKAPKTIFSRLVMQINSPRARRKSWYSGSTFVCVQYLSKQDDISCAVGIALELEIL